ncbi:MAG: glycosyltransferase family 9 protein [Planctomycetota bacterium]
MSPYSLVIRALGAGRRLLNRGAIRRRAARFAEHCRGQGRQPTALLLLERLGDFVAASAIVAGIRERHPEASIAWFGRARYRDLALLVPGVDDYIEVESYGELADVVDGLSDWHLVDLNLNGKQDAASPVAWRNRTGSTNVDTENYYDHGPLAVAFAKVAGLPWRPGAPTLGVPDVEVPRARAPYVVVHSESEESARNWNEAGWRKLAAWLLEHTELNIVHVGGQPANWLPSHAGVLELGGSTDQAQLIALVAGCSLFIGIDSSVANLANAFARPGLVLLGRYRRFARYLPYTGSYAFDERGGAAMVVRHASECPYLPYAIVERALHTVARRLRMGAPLGRGGAWDVRTHELPAAGSTSASSQDAEPDVAAVLTVRDAADADRWLARWPGEPSDLVFAIRPPAEHELDDEWLERLEATGARFVAHVDGEQCLAPRITGSYRYLRHRGTPVIVGHPQASPELLDPKHADDDELTSDAARWFAADVRELDPESSRELLTALQKRIEHDRERSFAAPAADAVLIPRPDGIKAGIDHVERAHDGCVTAISGWLFLESTGTPPACYYLCEPRPNGGFAVRHRAPFSRLERPDVAQAYTTPGATFSGLRIDVPDYLRNRDLAVLIADRATGTWQQLDLP